MKNTSRVLLLVTVCAIAVLHGGYASALPHSSHHYKAGEGYADYTWDDDGWGDKKHKEYEPKKDWFAWGYGKDHEKWEGGKDWGWGKDPDCDPPMTQTPEPGTLLLLGSSFAAAGLAWRRRAAVSGA